MSTKFIILTGNLKSGFMAHGPFESVYTTTSDDDGILVEDAAKILAKWVDASNSIHVVPLHPRKDVEEIKHNMTEQKRLSV